MNVCLNGRTVFYCTRRRWYIVSIFLTRFPIFVLSSRRSIRCDLDLYHYRHDCALTEGLVKDGIKHETRYRYLQAYECYGTRRIDFRLLQHEENSMIDLVCPIHPLLSPMNHQRRRTCEIDWWVKVLQ